MKTNYISKNVLETHKIAEIVWKQFLTEKIFQNQAKLIILKGDLGSGKTEFVKGLVKKANKKYKVFSPTFVLLKIYDVLTNKIKKIYHIDIYRLLNKKQLTTKDLEIFDFEDIINNQENLIIIEWGDQIKNIIKYKQLLVSIEIKKEKRQIKLNYLA